MLRKFKFLSDIYEKTKHGIAFVDDQPHQDFLLIIEFMMRDLVENINRDYELEMKFEEISRKRK
jgi:hypothetical protein